MPTSANVIVFGPTGDVEGAKGYPRHARYFEAHPQIKQHLCGQGSSRPLEAQHYRRCSSPEWRQGCIYLRDLGEAGSTGMHDTVIALKEAGIESAMRLSSYTVGDTSQTIEHQRSTQRGSLRKSKLFWGESQVCTLHFSSPAGGDLV
ncbi:hypothetical protein BJX76DRAFT_361806 [Aspergillus varians]